MNNKLTAFILTFILIASGSLVVFAEGQETTVLDHKYYGDYTTSTDLLEDTIDAGNLKVDISLNDIDWLDIENRSGSITFRTGAGIYSISDSLPNFRTFVNAQLRAQTKLVGYTFACNNIGGAWEEGAWTVSYNDPVGRIRTALDELRTYVEQNQLELCCNGVNDEQWTDNKISIKTGAKIQYGNSVIEFIKDSTIDDLYDPVKHETSYASQFAYILNQIRKNTNYSLADDRAIKMYIPAGTIIQFSETQFKFRKDLDIELVPDFDNGADPLSAVNDAIQTAGGSSKTKYSGYSCDPDAVVSSIFGMFNELLGVLAQKDTRIIIGADGSDKPDSAVADTDVVSAEIRVISMSADCKHTHTVVKGKMDPTFTVVGFTGDIYCADCGKMLKEGTMIPKKPSSIQLNASSLKLKVKQSSSALTVTYMNGDSIKTVTSSKTKVVQASQSGANKIKLKAGKKPGKAVVTVVLASGKKASVNVTVQKGAVKCTGIKVTNGTKVNLKKGKTYTIKAERKPITCVQKITYKSSNKKVATVTSKGKVKAKKKGSATIRIKCGSKTKKVKITVK